MTHSVSSSHTISFRPTRLSSALRGLWSSPRVWGVLAGTLPGLAAAGPLGEQVVSGDVSVNRPDGNHTVIDQGSTKAIVNWQQFSIAGDEYVQFNQPGSSALALNRVVGGDISNILGSLTANGQVFLVNPQGVYFGPNATVDVGGLVASILDIRDEDFLSGRYTFSRHPESPEGASVVNAGYLRAREGGYVVLAGDYTGNTGVVEARLGQVVLASGNRMTLDMAGDGLVSFAVDEATLSSLAGVENSGELLADGGRVVMTAQVAGDLMGTVVNNAGLVRAHGVAEHGGEIWLTAAGGDIENSGILDADGESGAGGGAVRVLGEGDIELPAGGAITARGDGSGGGGSVRVVADERLAFRLDHHIDVRGGAPNTGGFVEVSGHGGLQLAGTLKLGGGRVIIDPEKIHIVNGSAAPGGSYGSTGTASISKGWLADLLNGDDSPQTAGADVYLIASKSIEMDSGGALDGRRVGIFPGGDLHLIIGSPSDIGGISGGGSYGAFSPGLYNLNSTDPAASIVLNDDVLVSGNFVAITGRTAGGTGIGAVEVRDVTASQVMLGADSSNGSDIMAASVKAGTLTVFNGGNGVRVQAEDTVEVASIVSQFGDVLLTTGPTAANRSVTVTGSILSDRLKLGTKTGGAPGTNARSVSVGGDIDAGGFSNTMVEVTATDLIDLQNVVLDGAEGGTVLISGGTTATVTVGDVSVNETSSFGIDANITIDGATVDAGALAATAMGGSSVDAVISAQADNLTVGGAEAIASSGYATVSLQGRSTPSTMVTVNGLVKAMSPKGTDIDIVAQGDVAINGHVQEIFTGGTSDQAGDQLDIVSNDGTVTVANGVTVSHDAGTDASGARVLLRGGTGVVMNGTATATGTAPGGTQSAVVQLAKDGASATGSGLLDADHVEVSGFFGQQSNLSANLRTRADTLRIGNNDDSDHWASVAVENQSRSGGEVQITTNSTNTFDDLTLIVTGGDTRHNEVFASAGNFELMAGEAGSNFDLNVVGNTYRVDTIRLAAMGNLEAENVTITAPGGGFAQSVNLDAGDEGAGNAFDGVLNLGGATIGADSMELFSRGNMVLAANVGGAVLDGNVVTLSTDLGVNGVGDIDLTDASGYGVLITARHNLLMAAEGSIRNNFGDAMIQADALAMVAQQDIALGSTRIYVGDGVVRDDNGDPLVADAELINTLQQNAGQIFTDPEPASAELNAYLEAGNTLTLGSAAPGEDPNGDPDFFTADVSDDISAYGYLALQLGVGTDLDGDSVQDENNKAGYLWLGGKVIELGPVVGEAANIIVQWATPNNLEITGNGAPDAATQLAAATTYLTVPDHFSRFSGTTHAPGYTTHPLSNRLAEFATGPYVGNVNIPGSVNLGSANFFLLTGGSTTGLENVQTTGLVGLINVLAGPEEPPPEEPPPPPEMGELLDAVDSDEGDLEDLTNENTDPEDPESPEVNTDGDKALARVCQ